MLKKFRRLYLYILLMAGLAACKGKAGGGSSSGWQQGTEISAYNGGGMVPESETVIIKDSAGLYIHWHMPATDSARFILSATELDSLAIIINETGLRNMQSAETEEIIYDKPTTSITLKQGQQALTVSDGAGERIQNGKEKDFFALYNHILSLAKKKVAK